MDRREGISSRLHRREYMPARLLTDSMRPRFWSRLFARNRDCGTNQRGAPERATSSVSATEPEPDANSKARRMARSLGPAPWCHCVQGLAPFIVWYRTDVKILCTKCGNFIDSAPHTAA